MADRIDLPTNDGTVRPAPRPGPRCRLPEQVPERSRRWLRIDPAWEELLIPRQGPQGQSHWQCRQGVPAGSTGETPVALADIRVRHRGSRRRHPASRPMIQEPRRCLVR
jgi:hypothetical protein